MMEGTYYKEWSAVLDREMEFKVYGHGGVPVLALPARGGRFYDWENNARRSGPSAARGQNSALLRRQHRRREPAGGQ